MKLEDKVEYMFHKMMCCKEIVWLETYEDRPTTGMINTIYVDKEGATIYYWDGTDYISLGGGGEANINYAQLTNTFGDNQTVNTSQVNVVFTSVENVGDVVVGDIATNAITVLEDGYYDVNVSINGIPQDVIDIIVSLYVNGDTIYDIQDYSSGLPTGHVLFSWNKKLELTANDVLTVKISRPVGSALIAYYASDFSVMKIDIVGPRGPAGPSGGGGDCDCDPPVIISEEEPDAENGSLWVNPEESFELLNLYELAVINGFEGTLSEYLDSIQGAGGGQVGVRDNFRDVIPQGNAYCKELGAHHGITPIDPDTDPLPRVEFEDCSQIYNPKVIVVGDYYFMYYVGNTQKFKTNSAASETDRKKSDFGRVDRVFLAYRKVSEGLHGPWQKWEDGRTPVLDIADFDTNVFDRGNAWMRNVIYDGTQYVMAYTGDGVRDGSAHTFNPALATSPNGIEWTKLGAISSSGFVGNNLFMITNVGSTYYIYLTQGSTIKLYKNTSLSVSGWTFVGNLSATYTLVLNVFKVGTKIYVGVYKGSTQNEIYLIEIEEANIESVGSYVETGLLIEGNTLFGESFNGLAATPPTLNYHSVVYEGNDKWTVFYSYYKTRMARTPWVPETGIRSTTFTNTIPIPQP